MKALQAKVESAIILNMLTDVFPKLQAAKVVMGIRAFFRSPWYIAATTLLMVFSVLFGLELLCYWLLLGFGIVAALFDEDMLAVAPLAVCGYMSVSAKNNIGKHVEPTAFADPRFQLQLAFIAIVAAIVLLARLVSLLLQNRRRGVPRLTLGFAALGLAYLLGGAFSGGMLRSSLFGLVQIACLAGLYFYLYFTVDWTRVRTDYCAMLLTIVGMGLCVQIASMYFSETILGASSIDRGDLYLGWGIHNNVGCMMAMLLPAPFYFAIKRKHGWAFTLLGSAFLLFVALTQSRGAILFGAVVYVACAVFVLATTKGRERIYHLVVFLALVLAGVISFLIFRERLAKLFASVISSGFNDSLRFDTYRSCWARFLEYPLFGAGFYNTPGTLLIDGSMHTVDGAFGDAFLPPRAHNTVFQLLASGGIFAILCYGFHRAETLISLFRKPSVEKTIIFFSMLALLLTSLLDCHFFNFGPGLVYGILLVFAEGIDKRKHGDAPPYWLRKKQ